MFKTMFASILKHVQFPLLSKTILLAVVFDDVAFVFVFFSSLECKF